MIGRSSGERASDLSNVMRDFKKYTSGILYRAMQEDFESRREWLQQHFNRLPGFQVWRQGMHPIACFSEKFTNQKLRYIHENPVVAGIVREPEHYRLSSASDYSLNNKGLVDIKLIE